MGISINYLTQIIWAWLLIGAFLGGLIGFCTACMFGSFVIKELRKEIKRLSIELVSRGELLDEFCETWRTD